MRRYVLAPLRPWSFRKFSTQGQDNPAHIVESRFGKVDIPECSIPEAIWANMESWSHHIAIECGVTGRKYTYSQLRKHCRDFGAGLLNGPKRFEPGTVVSLVLNNSPDFPIAALGSLEAGLPISTVNPNYGPDDIRHQMEEANAKIVITEPSKETDVRTACSGKDIEIIVTGQKIDDIIMAGKGKELKTKLDPKSLAVMPFSSGTTGLPKGVCLSHYSINASVAQFSHRDIRLLVETTKNEQGVFLNLLPDFHAYGLILGLITCLQFGSKIVTLPAFEPKLFIKTVKESKVNVLHLVPPLIQFLVNHPDVTAEVLDTVTAITNGAAPLSPSYGEKLLKKKMVKLVSGYGMTEASPIIACCPNDKSDIESVGFIVGSAQLKIADVQTGCAIDPSSTGEICCRGPQLMMGYLNNEEATKATIKNGWLHSGDIGFVSKEDGRLYIVDRVKELIKVKGFQVAPVELENVLKTHPDIADAGVIGKPDERKGEAPVAFVVLRQKSKATEKDIIDFVASKITTSYKKIDAVNFIEAVPRNNTGKILRKDLKKFLQ